jgi:hypothetical protein
LRIGESALELGHLSVALGLVHLEELVPLR